MKNRFSKYVSGFSAGQAGQALVLVLIFFLLGSLTVTPLLMNMATALKAGTKYDLKTGELYTTDAGIENGLWRIKYDYLGPDYDPYDYTTQWLYETDHVNGRSADVLVQNVWIPGNVTLDELGLTPQSAKTMIESEKLVISGTAGAVPGQPFHIKMDFVPAAGDNLTIKSIGVWLPRGFTYDAGNSELEDLSTFDPCHPDSVSIEPVPGGQTVLWGYDPPYPLFTAFPNYTSVNGTMTSTFSFTYSPPAEDPEKMPLAVTWVVTDMEPTCPNTNDVPISWDTDMRYYKITSTSGTTHIEAIQSKSQLRNLGNGIAGDYIAVGNSLMIGNVEKRDELLASSSTNVSAVSPIPGDGDVLYAYLYWSGFRHSTGIFSDSCSDFDNWSRVNEDGSQTRVPAADGDSSVTWSPTPASPATCWDKVDETAPDDSDYMTGINDGDFQLFTFSPFSVPDQPIASLTVYFRAKDASNGNNNIQARIKVGGSYYNDGSLNPDLSWNTYSSAVWNTNPSTGAAWTVEDINGTGANPLEQFGVYGTDLSPDIQVSMVYARVNYLSTSLWTEYNYFGTELFQGQGSTDLTADLRTLTLKNPLDLHSYAPGTVAITWSQSESGTLSASDTFYYAFSSDNGTTWSDNIEAFHDDSPSSKFSAMVPEEYMTSLFKIRFYYNFNAATKYVRLDNINAYYMPPDTDVSFAINGQQVYFDAGGNPQAGAGNLDASFSAVLVNQTGTTLPGYSYACFKDVSALVKKYPVVEGEKHHTGNYNYTIGGVTADTGEYVSYAGWSLVIIYSSPSTAGRYIYLHDIHDIFAFNPGNTNLDFNNDGEDGGDVTGFLFPEPIRDKYGNIIDPTAAKITCFVGEGDGIYTGDSLMITGQQSALSEYVSNSASPSENIWNGASPGMSYPGVDVDTFTVLWEDGILTPKDTSLHLDMDSGTDAWNLIYIIMSVRSETVTSGAQHYIITRTP